MPSDASGGTGEFSREETKSDSLNYGGESAFEKFNFIFYFLYKYKYDKDPKYGSQFDPLDLEAR